MLQLDPSKRISLSKVLEHKWMQDETEKSVDRTPSERSLINRSTSGSIIWNEEVLLAIQRLNFNVEAVKQVHVHIIKYRYMYMYMYMYMCTC